MLGFYPSQFRQVTLESADDDGKLEPPSIQDGFAGQSLLMGMFIKGLITKRYNMNERGPWYITKQGVQVRAAASIGSNG